MFAGRPVIAVNSGGPTETVLHKATGFLCENSVSSFASAMAELAGSIELAQKMGRQAQAHAISSFSFNKFTSSLNDTVVSVGKLPAWNAGRILSWILVLLAVAPLLSLLLL